MEFARLIPFLALLVGWSEAKVDSSKLNMLFRKAEPCKEVNAYTHFSMFKFTSFGANQYGFDVDVDLKQDMPPTINPYVHTIRCNSYSDVNSCEYYTNITIKSAGCSLIKVKNQVWSNVVELMKLPCPFTVGKYQARNATIDASMVYKWLSDAEKYFWKVKFDLRHPQTKESMLCLMTEFEFARVKKAG